MKKVFYIAAALLCLSFPAAAQVACGQFDKAWSECEQDSDCTLAKDACGWPAAYNKNYTGPADSYNRCIAPMIECEEPKESGEQKKAVCNEGVCGFPGK